MSKCSSDTLDLLCAEPAPPRSNPYGEGRASSLERLLGASYRVPTDQGPRHAIAYLLDSFADILPGYALAVSIGSDDGQTPVVLQHSSAPAPVHDPSSARIFPMFAHEHIETLTCRAQPSRLHCAGNDPGLNNAHSSLATLLGHCAGMLSRAIDTAESSQQARLQMHETQSLRQMVLQADKLATLGELSAGLVHEISNPLTAIIAYTDFLLRKAERHGDMADVERLCRITEAANRILSFSRDLISYARPSVQAPGPQPIEAAVERAISYCQHIVNESHVSVQRNYAQGLPAVRGVSAQLTQVFVNLVTNACQAMAPTGGTLTVTIEAEKTTGGVLVHVTDTGPGIAPDIIPDIFKAFFTTKSHAQGTGLGLRIVRQIINQHGGEVTVESRLGEGTTFTVWLPGADGEGAGQ